MTNNSITQTTLRLIAGCSFAMLIAAGSAFAHGGDHNGGNQSGNGGDHASNGGHGRCIDCNGGKWSSKDHDDDDDDHDHHHHHHHPPLHGPGSSHNPVVYHPPLKPIPKPITGVGPAKPVGTTVVRDHRTPPPRVHPGRPDPTCNQHNITGCDVRDHRTPPPTQCLGNLC